MKRRKLIFARARDDCRGTTLVEAVCGILILTVIVVAMYSGFLVAQRAFGDGDIREELGQEAFGTLENGEGTKDSDILLNLPLGSGKVSFKGQYTKAGGKAGGTTLFTFDTSTVSFEDGVRNIYIYWFNRLNGMDKNQWKDEGYPASYLNNSILRNWLKDKEYGGNWPLLSADLLERYLTPEEKQKESQRVDNLLTTPTYIQPYYGFPSSPDAYNADLNTIVYASEKQGGTGIRDDWNTRLVYDHDEGAWYYRPLGDKAFFVGQDWDYIKNVIHGADWRKLV